MNLSGKEYAVISKAIGGDKMAFGELCQIIAPQVIYMSRRQLNNWQDAEDVSQEVLVYLQKNITKINSPQAFYAWLNKIISHKCIDMRRKTMRHDNQLPIDEMVELNLIDPLEVLPADFVEVRELQEHMVCLIDELPFTHRQCVLLHYYQKLSYAEISVILECSEEKVRYNLRRARMMLKVMLEEEKEEDPAVAKMYSASPVVAIGPALKKIFSDSEQATVPQVLVRSCLAGAGVAAANGVAGAAGGTAVSGLWQAMGGAAKIAAIIVSAAAGIAAAVYITTRIITPMLSAPPPAIEPFENIPQDFINGKMAGSGDEDIPAQTAAALSGRVKLDNTSAPDKNAQNGLSGIKIELINADDGRVLVEQKTESGENQGAYSFEGMPPGRYKIRAVLPPGAEVVKPTGGSSTVQNGSETAVWLEQQGNTVFNINENVADDISDIDLILSFTAEIKGKVILDGEAASLKGLTLNLEDPQGFVIASTKAEDGGEYRINNPMVSQSGEYTLRFSFSGINGVSLPYDSIAIQLSPGQSATVAAQKLRDTQSPHLMIHIIGGESSTHHINPDGVSVYADDFGTAAIRWQLFNYDTGDKIADGTTNEELAKIIPNLDEGSYMLKVTATDAAGNTAKAEQAIVISNG